MNYNLKMYRRMLKLSQPQIAEQIGMSKTSYSKRETGAQEFKQSEMINIMGIINKSYPSVSMEDVFLKVNEPVRR